MRKAVKNYLAKLHENKEKGFSLVELIIVIAIMAILVGVVASQVIPYMEKSRQAKDQQHLSSIATAMVSAIAQSPVDVQPVTDAVELSGIDDTFGGNIREKTNVGSNLADLLGAKEEGEGDNKKSALKAYEDSVKGKFKSKLAKDAKSGIYVKYENGVVSVFLSTDSGKNAVSNTLTVESE